MATFRLAALLLLVPAAAAQELTPLAKDAITEDWPGFLGPRRDGRSKEAPLLKKWSKGGPTLVWSKTRGSGFASPAVQGDRLVFPHRVGNKTHVDCLHAETGKRHWRFSYPMEYRDEFIEDSGPRATPQIDGSHVYVHGVEGMLHCLDLATGDIIWKRNLKEDFKLEDMFFGVVASPLVSGDHLILNIGTPGPTVAALDKNTGKLVWKAGTKWGASCASPVLAKVHGRSRLLVLAGGKSRPPTGGLMVLDPNTGKVDLEVPFRSRTYLSVTGASPVVAGSRVFLTAAYNTGTLALDLQEDGGFKKVWSRRRFGIEFTTPLHVGGYLYMVHGVHGRAGAIVCLDPNTGKELARTEVNWEETVDLRGTPQKLSLSIGAGSMIHADGAFLCLGDSGHLLWLECTPKGAKVLARATLFHAAQSWTPPVISRGLLYVCQNKPERFGKKPQPRRLLCYDLRGER